jgi:CRP/FNR family transcriptional regulator, cyclic AMP receptor protein
VGNGCGHRPERGPPEERLHRIAPFDALTPSDMIDLQRETRFRHVRRGDIVYQRGEPVAGLSVILRGAVRVGSGTSDGRRLAWGVAGPGEVLGVLSFLDEGPASGDAHALGDGMVASVPFRAMRDHVERSPPLALTFARIAAAEVRQAQELLVDVAWVDASRRLARVLLQLADRFGVSTGRGPAMAIDLPVVQQDLADLAGAARETASKHLSSFARAGWIAFEDRRYVVIDGHSLGRHYLGDAASRDPGVVGVASA